MAEPFLFWFFRAANEVQPSHEWERYHLRPAHPAVSAKGSGAGGRGELFCLLALRNRLFILRGAVPVSQLSPPFHYLCSDQAVSQGA